jgi:hypothetical protein
MKKEDATMPHRRPYETSIAGTVLGVLFFIAAAWGADRVVIVREDTRSTPGLNHVTAAYWFAVPAGQELPKPGFTSCFPGASSDETTELQTGRVEEECFTQPIASSLTAAQKQASLQAVWNDRNTYRNSQTQSGENYGRTMNDQGVWRGKHCPGGLGCP